MPFYRLAINSGSAIYLYAESEEAAKDEAVHRCLLAEGEEIVQVMESYEYLHRRVILRIDEKQEG